MSVIAMRSAVRLYSRWRSRKTGAVNLPFDDSSNIIDITDIHKKNDLQKPAAEKKHKTEIIEPTNNENKSLPHDYFLKKVKPVKKSSTISAEKSTPPRTPIKNEVFDSNGELIYTKLPYKDTKIRYYYTILM